MARECEVHRAYARGGREFARASRRCDFSSLARRAFVHTKVLHARAHARRRGLSRTQNHSTHTHA
eukprot:5023819-Pleurochrysis_carterae.AAC.1